MITRLLLARLLLLLAIFGGVLARRGGDHDSESSSNSDNDSSSSDDSDSSDSSSGSGSGSSSGPPNCGSEGSRNGLSSTYLMPVNVRNWTSLSGAFAVDQPTIYDGSFFQGEGYLSYNRTSDSPCRASKNIRILGYAWVGPQPPYPRGADNPFIVGFKAWASDKAVKDIHTSYSRIRWKWDSCPTEPDLFRIVTTKGTESSNRTAEDIMPLDIFTDSTAPDAVQFNATTARDSKYEGLFRLRPDSCDTDNKNLFWPSTTIMKGSVTNNTLRLEFSGLLDMNATEYQTHGSRDDDTKVNFTVSFTGHFDSANSTHALTVENGNQTLTWVPNSGSYVLSGGWGYIVVWTVGIQMIISTLW